MEANFLNGKIAIVTGANSGIGKEIAYALSASGASVVIASRRMELNQQVALEIETKTFAKTLPLEIDVSKEESCIRLITETVNCFGRIDILVNNAGIGIYAPLDELSTLSFDRMLKTNLYGTFWCSREAFKQMKKQQTGGYIINISSLAGVEAWANTAGYSASKFGVMGLTKAMADEGKRYNIKVTAICPGMVATPMTGVEGVFYIQPEDIAQTVLYLLSLSEACWLTEIVIPRKGAE
ncbi:NAD(P)-dependent oxidoreductase [Candidatus Methylacidiphilum fumarolicum]|uniref:Short-chain alcohol dehydrogenase n=2 Tax=Candidatus Methylacidiphilum fumarolicum TaxID=591154 RepID=I0JZX5_METFB|nr:SDR family oxidoreductase [Candidatus Methylacidiphilum fumarolicum]MBW6415890.1 SDR family oxidoreductase [Candidatus Methylacidiphilum fumarolicum]TFE67651.1 alcohol dehydrogenase [Candidatus Methylacidiphilum fumarolicum]TFE71755.1 NAD(P)-dependent oxidoreductase [Candidatus Methylacidiphilum fumarolicum]TFE71869.1 NAD(P)-dependent oxidoreductase [Candidatus Methylacidiphilum fumarolicum]TFE76447.1 alcohol dehydrogenase [Candidatus Methylacidiphilum fumarolicum]